MSLSLPGTVAVTGATGLIGRRLVPALLADGVAVRVLSRASSSSTFAGGVVAVPGDLCDEASLVNLLNDADAVVHLAGIAHTTLRTPAELAAAQAVNVDGTRRLLHAAQRAGVPHLVYFSSAHVYAGQHGIDLSEDSEKDTGPGYSAFKLEAEKLLQQEGGDLRTLTILRPCLTYGPGVRFNLQQLMSAIQFGRYVHPGGADVLRSFASVDTVAAAVLHTLRQRVGGTFNVADREPQRLSWWVDALALAIGVRTPRTVPVAFLRTLALIGDIARSARLPAPLTTPALRKLTVPFSLNVERLAATGFTWPATNGTTLHEMVAAFQARHAETERS